MKPEIKYFQNIVIDLHLFTPVVRLAIFIIDLCDFSAEGLVLGSRMFPKVGVKVVV